MEVELGVREIRPSLEVGIRGPVARELVVGEAETHGHQVLGAESDGGEAEKLAGTAELLVAPGGMDHVLNAPADRAKHRSQRIRGKSGFRHVWKGERGTPGRTRGGCEIPVPPSKHNGPADMASSTGT